MLSILLFLLTNYESYVLVKSSELNSFDCSILELSERIKNEIEEDDDDDEVELLLSSNFEVLSQN